MATMTGVVAGFALWRAEPASRGLIGILACSVFIKLLSDANNVGPDFTTLPHGIQLAWQAHILGAILGVAFTLMHDNREKHESRQPIHEQ
jgi:membrane associated rhomboid family serine protease